MLFSWKAKGIMGLLGEGEGDIGLAKEDILRGG